MTSWSYGCPASTNCGAYHTAANLPGTRAESLADSQKGMALDQFLAQHQAFNATMPVRLVELRGIEPLTSAVRLQRSPI